MSLIRVRRFLTTSLCALAALPMIGSRLSAQTGTITGKVTDAATGAPIENVEVRASGAQTFGAVSGADGTYRIVNLTDGTYTLVARRIGFEPKTITGVRPGTTTNIALTARTIQLNETVVTASRTRPEKALDAPAQISVISSERIEERPAVTVTDHLRGVPGVDISKGGIAQANVVARGFNNAFSGSMLMLQDYRFAGVPSLRVNVPFLFTGTNEDVDRIEVLLGPASALYGPNSSSGVLHVITKSPFNSQGTTISVDGGERSVIRTGLRHAGKVNNKLAYKLSGEYMQGRDWEYNDKSEPLTFPNSTSIPASRRGQPNQRDFDLQRFTGEGRIDIRPREGMEAITTLGYTNIGSGMELTGANGTSQIKGWTYTSLQQRFRWNKLFMQAFLNISNAGNDTSSSDKGTYLLRSGQPIVDQSRVMALQAQHGFEMSGGKQSFTYGVDYIKTDPRTGGTINGANELVDNVSEYGAYIQSSTKPTKQIELLLAARADKNNVIEDNFFSPRAALIFKPTENQNIRATYNRAFSTPANFSFFLDLISSPNVGGSGFDLRARGNPPKTGFTFNQSCQNSAFGAYCMKSRFTGGGAFVGASAASAFPALVQGNATALAAAIQPSIIGALQQAGLSAAQAGALGPQLAAGALQYLGTRAPTNTDITTRVSYLTSGSVGLATSDLKAIEPLGASYNQTYELGYKGIIGNKFRFDISLWGQDRGDVATTAALATPNVFANAASMGPYIGAQLGGYLVPALMQQAGMSQQQATALAGVLAPGLATGLTTALAPAPLGVVTFNDPNTSPTAIYATYQKVDKKIWVKGLDLATDIVVSDRLTFEASYSYQNQNVWKDIIIGGIPFMSNSAASRGSIGGRYRNEGNGIGFELRTRYNEAYPINSGVYATNTAFALAAGQTGAGTAASTALGYNKCNPPAAATFCYENVPEAFTFDAQFTKRFDMGSQKVTWTLGATNVFDNRVRTFAGAPEIGRMIMTRLQYSF